MAWGMQNRARDKGQGRGKLALVPKLGFSGLVDFFPYWRRLPYHLPFVGVRKHTENLRHPPLRARQAGRRSAALRVVVHLLPGASDCLGRLIAGKVGCGGLIP